MLNWMLSVAEQSPCFLYCLKSNVQNSFHCERSCTSVSRLHFVPSVASKKLQFLCHHSLMLYTLSINTSVTICKAEQISVAIVWLYIHLLDGLSKEVNKKLNTRLNSFLPPSGVCCVQTGICQQSSETKLQYHYYKLLGSYVSNSQAETHPKSKHSHTNTLTVQLYSG